MQLIATTPSGLCLAFTATPTGNIDLCADGFTVASIEVQIWGVCTRMTGVGPVPLDTGTANILKRMWVRPDDLCDDSGTPFKHEELIHAVETVREALKRSMAKSPLGENWP